MTETHEITTFQYDLLRAVATLGTPSGQRVRRYIEEDYETDVPHSRVYQDLTDLSEAGFLGKGWKNGRESEYDLTDAGLDLLTERVLELSDPLDDVQVVISSE
jgi:DNA-binding PadR family transcriptional regulator